MHRGVLPNNIPAFCEYTATHKGEATFDPREPIARVIDAYRQRTAIEAKRVILAQMLGDIPGFWACYEREMARAAGSKETQATYRQAVAGYTDFCADQQLPAFPATAEVLAHYLLFEGGNGARPEKLRRIVSAVKFYESWREPPLDDVLVKAMLAWQEDRWNESHEKEAETETEQPAASNGPAQH
jgi:hypothetical protein